MKILITILFFLYSFFALSQYNLTVKGTVKDKLIGIDVAHPEITVITSTGIQLKAVGDSSGYFSLNFSSSNDTLDAVISVNAKNQMNLNEKLLMIIESDTIIKLNLLMSPQEVCHDSFLPSPLFFEFNSTTLKDKKFISNLESFFSEKNNEFFDDALRIKSGIAIYCVQGFNEKKGIAQKRAEFIKTFFNSNSAIRNKIKISVINTDDYFYCTNCNGCFEYYKYGQGIELNKSTIEKHPQLDQLRQVIEIKWVENDN